MRIKEYNKSKYFQINDKTVICVDHPQGIIMIEALPEVMDSIDYWWKETDCFNTRAQAKRFAEKSDNPFWFCCIKVSVTNPDTLEEKETYLSACNYSNGLDFVDGDYFEDMLAELV